MRAILISCFFLCWWSAVALAQGAPGTKKLSLPVDFEVVNGDFSNTVVYMRRGNETVATFKGARSMRVKLDYNSEYRLDFTKPGYITKSVMVNTQVTEERRKIGFDPYKIGVRLFKQYEGVNIVVYNQPVASIRFLPDYDEFGYDTDYTKSILSELKLAEDLLEKKAAEERKLDRLAGLKKKEDKKSEVRLTAEPSKRALDVPVNTAPVEPDPSAAVQSSADPGSKTPSVQPDLAADGIRAEGGFGSGGDDPLSTGVSGAGEAPIAGYPPANGDEVPAINLASSDGAEPALTEVIVPAIQERSVEVIRERNRTITVFLLKEGDKVKSCKMVQYDWGGLFYFVNDHQTVSKHLFDFYIRPASR
jgi:hypothetical protein